MPKGESNNGQNVIQRLMRMIVSKQLISYEDSAKSIFNSIIIPFNAHNHSIDLSHPIFDVKIVKETKSMVQGQMTINFNHRNTIRRSMSNKPHDPVDLMYLFNNGWKNSKVIPNYDLSNGRYLTSRNNRGLKSPGDYAGDGYMNQFVDMFRSAHPEVDVVLNPDYKEPQG